MIELTPEQEEIQRVCRDFAAREIRPAAAAVDEADTETPWALWRKAAAIGLTSFMLPEALGGGGLTDTFTGCLVQEELCHGCSGIGNLVTSNGFFAEPILALGTPEQQERWLRPLTTDDPPMTALATTEPDSGSDAASMRTTAKRVDGGYVLNGQKAWISNGGAARFYVVFTTVAPGTGHRGVTAFLLDRDDEGLSFGEPMRKMGQRAILNTELFLHDCFVADDRRLGAEGEGFRGLMETFDRSRVTLASAATGLARAATEYATAYAKERVQFGKPIGSYQAVKHLLATAQVKIEFARPVAYAAAAGLSANDAFSRARISHAKLAAVEAADLACRTAVQVHGAMGYSWEVDVHFFLKRALALSNWWGDRRFHLGRVAHHVDGEMLCLVPLGRMRGQFRVRELPRRVLDGALVVVEGEVHGCFLERFEGF